MTEKVLKIYKGVNWILLVSWYAKFTGMLTFFILARYLNQTDFGIVAGCYIVQGFFAVLANFGTGQYLVRKKEILKEDLDAAWTINVATRTIIAIVIFLLSDSIATFMNITELSLVLKLMSLSPFFIGLHNPALNLKIKQLDYAAISYLKIITKTISSTLSLVIAIMYQTYFAIVIGEVIYQATFAVGSFIVHRYQPAFCVKKILDQWCFSKWVFFKGLISYVKYSCDSIIVSRIYSLEELGLFNFSKEVASTIYNILIEPISSIFYPSLSEYVDDYKVLVDKIYKFIMVIGFIYTPFVFGGIYLSESIILYLFGEKWIESVFLFNLFLANSLAKSLIQLMANVFLLINEVKKHFVFEIVTSIIMVLSLLGFSYFSLESFTIARMIISFLMLYLMLLFLSKILPMSLTTLCKIVSLPIMMSSLMILVLIIFETQLHSMNSIFNLFVLIVVGGVFYISSSVFVLRILQEQNCFYKYLYESVIFKLFAILHNKTQKILNRNGI